MRGVDLLKYLVLSFKYINVWCTRLKHRYFWTAAKLAVKFFQKWDVP